MKEAHCIRLYDRLGVHRFTLLPCLDGVGYDLARPCGDVLLCGSDGCLDELVEATLATQEPVLLRRPSLPIAPAKAWTRSVARLPLDVRFPAHYGEATLSAETHYLGDAAYAATPRVSLVSSLAADPLIERIPLIRSLPAGAVVELWYPNKATAPTLADARRGVFVLVREHEELRLICRACDLVEGSL